MIAECLLKYQVICFSNFDFEKCDTLTEDFLFFITPVYK